jgi:orotidine-5'-phosphate decarboxylase
MHAAEQVTPADPSEKIIVALDVDSPGAARAIVEELGDSVGAYKVGLQLFTAAGPDFVRELTEAGNRVFLDLKFHDIPNTVARAGVEAAKLGVWMFNVHALGGREMMRHTAETVAGYCRDSGIAKPKIIAVTILTSSDANDLREIGIEADVEKAVVSLAQLTSQCGLDGVVASAREASVIKRSVGGVFSVVTPGIRPSSETKDDQKRVNTPKAAVEGGADYLVIGRPITEATNKRQAAIEIANQISLNSDPIPE